MWRRWGRPGFWARAPAFRESTARSLVDQDLCRRFPECWRPRPKSRTDQSGGRCLTSALVLLESNTLQTVIGSSSRNLSWNSRTSCNCRWLTPSLPTGPRWTTDGRLILPPHIAARLGLTPGAQLRIDEDANSLRLHRPITHLARLYVEPTDACNLDCITCFRNAWQSSIGRMSDATFAAILAGVRALPEPPTVYFGGIGEPLVHTRTIDWIAQAKALGARVEMITNGTLLDEGARPGADRRRAGPAVGLHRRCAAGELRRRAPGRGTAHRARQPGAPVRPAARRPLPQAGDRRRLRGHEAQHRRPARGAAARPEPGRPPLLGQQRGARDGGAAGRGALLQDAALGDVHGHARGCRAWSCPRWISPS